MIALLFLKFKRGRIFLELLESIHVTHSRQLCIPHRWCDPPIKDSASEKNLGSRLWRILFCFLFSFSFLFLAKDQYLYSSFWLAPLHNVSKRGRWQANRNSFTIFYINFTFFPFSRGIFWNEKKINITRSHISSNRKL